ncbi:hypothetical protein JCM12856_17720 [Spirochaeta dissipatitropha]
MEEAYRDNTAITMNSQGISRVFDHTMIARKEAIPKMNNSAANIQNWELVIPYY